MADAGRRQIRGDEPLHSLPRDATMLTSPAQSGGWPRSLTTAEGAPGPSLLGTGGRGIELRPLDQSGQLKAVEPSCGVFIERQGCRTTSPDAEGADQGVFEGSDSIAERYNGVIDLLLILNLECIRR